MSAPKAKRAAIVGTGAIAHAHAAAIKAQPDRVELVAAVDVERERLDGFCGAYAIDSGYDALDHMLRVEKPDLVHVCTPPSTHVEVAVACLEAGSWVLVEKPPCLSLAEFDRMAAAERPGGPYASVVFQHRFGSGGLRAAELISSGELGRPLVAVCNTTWYRDARYFDVPWRGRWETEGGGPTMGHGIHQMDLLLALLGEWVEITAWAGRLDRAIETEDVSMAQVRFANGAMASIVNSVLSPREESYIRVDLTDATVEVRHLYGYSNSDWTYTPAPHVTDADRVTAWSTLDADYAGSHAAQLALVLDALDAGVRPPTSGSQGRETLELVTGLYRSAFTGERVFRKDLGPDDPFYWHLHGDVAGWAPPPLAAADGAAS